MNSGIAAPVGGRVRRARAPQHGSAWDAERRSLRRHLHVTTLRALDDMATAGAEVDSASIMRAAGQAATDLRAYVRTLSEHDGSGAVAELRHQVGGMLHDSTLQALEYLASDGYGAELEAEAVRRVAADAALELRGNLLRLGAPEHCELVSALREVVSAAGRHGDAQLRLVADDVDGRVYGADAAAIVGAVREALNNVNKHAHASEVVVRCQIGRGGARVSVQDDGIGADLDRLDAGIGLRHSIIDRMARRGGHADVATAPGRGMLITLTMAGSQEVAA